MSDESKFPGSGEVYAYPVGKGRNPKGGVRGVERV